MIKKEDIERKWGRKIEEMKRNAHIKYQLMLERRRRKKEGELARIKASMDRKEQAYVKKKEIEYRRKMNNEIRAMQGKTPKEYKTKIKLKPLQFALAISQENAKLRDTDENGNGRCISCDKECSW